VAIGNGVQIFFPYSLLAIRYSPAEGVYMIHDALVIGAGPAGATAALMLARAGWRVAVVEKAAFPRRKVCGEFISATSLPLLHELGVAESYLTQAGPEVRRVGFFAQDVALAAPMPSISGTRGWGRALGREHLDLMLLDAAVAAGARLWQPWAVTELQPSAAGHVAVVAARNGGAEIEARLVIAAPGSWERNAWALPATKAHKRSDLLAFKAHFTDADLPTDLMPLLVFPGGYGGMVHSDGGRVTLSCCIRRDALARCRDRAPQAGHAVLRHIQESCTGVREALRQAQRVGSFLSAGPIRPGIRRRYADRIFFAGNTAGEAHPIVAEGISMAMQSAWLLCRRLIEDQDALAAGYAPTDLGDAYAAEWRSSFATRVRAAALFAQAATRPRIGRPLLPLIRRFPEILTLGACLSGKVRGVVAAT
jgi:flavin-dependent dehydrogenase